jgi:PIN domain nuclease of toxin-antitoxin system
LKLLFDTHIWLWSVSNPSRLARRVKVELSRSSNELWISPISAWELLILAERGRIKLDDEPRKWVIEAFTRTPAQEAAINVEIAVRSREIMARHPDPADRFLVATALVYGLTLVTADAALIGAKVCPVLVNR